MSSIPSRPIAFVVVHNDAPTEIVALGGPVRRGSIQSYPLERPLTLCDGDAITLILELLMPGGKRIMSFDWGGSTPNLTLFELTSPVVVREQPSLPDALDEGSGFSIGAKYADEDAIGLN